MKKKFRVTVNGKDYDVEVEEIKDGVVREQQPAPKVVLKKVRNFFKPS